MVRIGGFQLLRFCFVAGVQGCVVLRSSYSGCEVLEHGSCFIRRRFKVWIVFCMETVSMGGAVKGQDCEAMAQGSCSPGGWSGGDL